MRNLVIAILALVAASGAAAAADCKPSLVGSLPFVPEPGLPVAVNVTIDGVERPVLIDTAAGHSFVTQEFAEAVGMPQHRISENVKITTLFGEATHYAIAKQLIIGHAAASNTELVVMPGSFRRDPKLAGIIGVDLLANFGVEFDFARAKMNLISAKCSDIGAYWAAHFTELPLDMKTLGKPVSTFSLDGKPVSVSFSTMGYQSQMSFRVAHDKFDLSPTSSGVSQAPNNGSPAYFYKFGTLSAEGVAVNNPLVQLSGKTDDPTCDGHEHFGTAHGGTALVTCVSFGDILLGLKELNQLHLYFDFPNKKLALTAASEH